MDTSTDYCAESSHRGSCLCGRVTYQASELNGPYVYCHCQSCRKANGTAFAANVSSPFDSFEVLSGTDDLKSFESSPDKHRHFCGNCGSPLFTTVGKDPKVVRIRLGTLDTHFSEKAAAHIFVSENPKWHEIADSAPRFDAWPSKDAVLIPGSRQGD